MEEVLWRILESESKNGRESREMGEIRKVVISEILLDKSG